MTKILLNLKVIYYI